MKTRKLGGSGLEVSPICLGGNVFGWTADEPTSFAILDAFVGAGFNFVDTADVYSRWVPGHKGGESETVLGNWFKRSGNRKKVILATKVGIELAPDKKGFRRPTSCAKWRIRCSACKPITSTCINPTSTTRACRWRKRSRLTSN